LNDLGRVLLKRKKLAEAEDTQRRALAIWDKLSPRSAGQAETLAALADILIQKKQPDEAAKLYEQSLNVLEDQTARLGGSDAVRVGFRAKTRRLLQGLC
jgi:tetratricopeptide (TPR) repeat protein